MFRRIGRFIILWGAFLQNKGGWLKWLDVRYSFYMESMRSELWDATISDEEFKRKLKEIEDSA